MAALTPAQLREHVETDLGDTALQRLLDDAYFTITERAGALGVVTARFIGNGDSVIWLGGRVATLPFTSVTENGVALVENTDYRVLYDGRGLERIDATTTPVRTRYWGLDVVLTYTKRNDEVRRNRVAIDLCKLAVQFDGTQSSSAGDYRQDNPDYQRAREQVLRGLVASPFTFA